MKLHGSLACCRVTTPSGLVELPAMTSSHGVASTRRALSWDTRIVVDRFCVALSSRKKPLVGSALTVLDENRYRSGLALEALSTTCVNTSLIASRDAFRTGNTSRFR